MTVCYWCGAKDTLADIGKELDDGKYKMVQCSKCKNAYYVVNKEKMKKPKPMTNEEWLRQASTEELAWFIADVCYELQDDIWSNCEDTSCDYRQTDKDYWVWWLKQPHTNE